MKTCIAYLRGINVSGAKPIKMADLRAALESTSLSNVRTYIQSGNIVFETDNADSAADVIHECIEKHFGYDVPVVIRSVEEMVRIRDNNPFVGREGVDDSRLYVVHLSEEPEAARLEALKAISFPPDEFVVKGLEVYLYCPVSFGKSKLNNNFFESKLKVKATTRNWKTHNTMIDLAS